MLLPSIVKYLCVVGLVCWGCCGFSIAQRGGDRSGSQLTSDPVYIVLWFDTEDYILPASDDAALRIASFLLSVGVKATFKIVGEKARTLERRGRQDVVAAIGRHEIGYHSNLHSQHPTPAERF